MRTEDRRHEYVEIERVWIAEDGKEFHDGMECLRYEKMCKNPPIEKIRMLLSEFDGLTIFSKELANKTLFYSDENPENAVLFFKKENPEKEICLDANDESRYEMEFDKDYEKDYDDEDQNSNLKYWYFLNKDTVVSLLTLKEELDEFVDSIKEFRNKIPLNKNNQKA